MMKKSVIIALLLLIVLPITLSGCDYITGKALGPTKSIPPRWVWGLAGENAPPTIVDRYSHELITDVSPEEAFGIIGTSQLINNPVVIDVRTPQEYTAGHIWQAINIDYPSSAFKDDNQPVWIKTIPLSFIAKQATAATWRVRKWKNLVLSMSST